MSESTPGPQLPHRRPALPREPEHYWYLVALVAGLIYLYALALYLSLIRGIVAPPFLIKLGEFTAGYRMAGMPGIIIGAKALIQMRRKPCWPEALMILAAIVGLVSLRIGVGAFEIGRMGSTLDDLSSVMLALGYYGWAVKASPGEKVAGAPVWVQMLILALGSGLLFGLAQAVLRNFLPLPFGWIFLANLCELAMIGTMVVGAVLRATRVGGWADWMQFAGMGIVFVVFLTVLIIYLQLEPLTDMATGYRRTYTELFATTPALLLFAIGFFAARPAE